MIRRFCLSAAMAGAMALTGQTAHAQQDLGDMVGTIAKTLLEQQQAAQDNALWQGVVENGSAAAFRQYLDTYPQGLHAREARQRLAGAPNGGGSGNNGNGNGNGASFAQQEARLALSQSERMAIQRRLAALGYYSSGIDGDFGAGTRRAIASWQASSNLPGRGYLNAEQSRALRSGTQVTTPTPNAPAGGSAAQVERDLGLPRSGRVQLQRQLIALGYDPKGADGLFGSGTREAIREWQRDVGQPVTGYVTAAQIRSLQQQAAGRGGATGNGTTGSASAALNEELLALSRAERVEIQQQLISLGYLSGGADGIFGSGTRGAIARWQGDNGMSETRYLTAEQVRALQRQARI